MSTTEQRPPSFATEAKQATEQTSREAIRTAVHTLVEGGAYRVEIALGVMVASVQRQARLNGCGV